MNWTKNAALAGVFALALSACQFSSEQAFYAPSEAATPIADGAGFVWRATPNEPGDDALHVTFHQDGGGYRLSSREHPGEDLSDLLLIPIAGTPEDDYVVQLRSDAQSEGRVYAFLWRAGEEWRAFVEPLSFEGAEAPAEAQRYCGVHAYGACVFGSREDLMRYYMAYVWPDFVAGERAPDSYISLTPDPAP